MRICTLASSSSGNCTLISEGQTHILIDAGISMTRIKKSLAALELEPKALSGIFVTHEHSDHISGIKMMSKYFALPLHAPPHVAEILTTDIHEAYGLVSPQNIGREISLGSLSIQSFRTLHDTQESVGYRIYGEKTSMAFVTDLGCVTDDVREAVFGADVAIIESNHDIDMLKRGAYPYYLKQRILSSHGHLSNNDSGVFASELLSHGTKKLVLAHLSRENNTPRLARDTVLTALQKSGAGVDEDFELSVAPADTTQIIYI